jgi:hypothetical protein
MVCSPRASEEWEDETLAVTWQAVSSVLKVLLAVLLTFGAALGLYTLATLWFGTTSRFDCPDQPIPNGIIVAGKANTTAAVRCDEGYKVGDTSKLSELMCRRFEQTCEVVQIATTLSDEETACQDLYAYTIPGGMASVLAILKRESQEKEKGNSPIAQPRRALGRNMEYSSEQNEGKTAENTNSKAMESASGSYKGPAKNAIGLWGNSAHRTAVLSVKPTKAELHAIAEIEAVADQVAKDACVALPWLPGSIEGSQLYSAKASSLRAAAVPGAVTQVSFLQKAMVPALLVATVLALVGAGIRQGRASRFNRTDEPDSASEDLWEDHLDDKCSLRCATHLPAE